MGKITYNLSDFEKNRAKQGALVVAVKSDWTGSPINSMKQSGNTLIKNTPYFLGAGVCKLNGNIYVLTVDSTDYEFNEYGLGVNNVSKDYVLKMGEVSTSIVLAGNTVSSTTTAITTRTAQGETEETTDSTVINNEGNDNVVIDNMSVRDQFAIHALRGILAQVKDPASVSTGVMNTYCETAYQWAAYMMAAAANARAELEDKTETDEVEEAKVGSLEGNTEKLLNNIWSALRKTDYVEEIEPEEEGEEPIKIYSERIINPELNKILEAYLKHTPTSEEDTQKYVELEEFLVLLKKYFKHTSTGEEDTQEYSAFEDLTILLKNLQETDSEKIYERVLIKDMDTLVDKINTMNTNLVAIKTAIESQTIAITSIATAINNLHSSSDTNDNDVTEPEDNGGE